MQKIRLILNQNCQYNCIFCHKENIHYHNQSKSLNAQDYAFFVRTAKQLGFNIIALTGGEPLLREDILDIIKAIAKTKCKLQITTNGILLNKLNRINCIDHINVSLHTLDKNVYNQITNSNKDPMDILEYIKEFKSINSTAIKINMLALKTLTLNKDNLSKMIDICKQLGIELKIIELLNHKSSLYFPYKDIQKQLQKLGYQSLRDYRGGQVLINSTSKVIIQRCLCNYIKGRDDSDSYCQKYNDLFLTPDGQLNYCRYKEPLNAYDFIKSRDKKQLKNLIEKSITLTNQCPLKTDIKKQILT